MIATPGNQDPASVVDVGDGAEVDEGVVRPVPVHGLKRLGRDAIEDDIERCPGLAAYRCDDVQYELPGRLDRIAHTTRA